MINNPEPSGLGEDKSEQKKWNSDDMALPGMTCDEAARFMTAYITSFRMLAGAGVDGGTEAQLGVVIRLMQLQRLAVYSDELKDLDKKKAEKAVKLDMAAVGMAAACVGNKETDFGNLFKLCALATQAAADLGESNPKWPESGELRFGIRIKDGVIEVGSKIVPLDEIKKAIKESGIEAMVKKYQNNQGKQGNN